MPKNFPITEITKGSTQYPSALKHIHDAPGRLYCRGNRDLLRSDCFGVVGTRKLTPYGRAVTEQIVRELVGHGLTIVSGLAMGIDAVAHRATLDAGGATIAVLGSGADDRTIAPQTNSVLAQDILKHGGCIVSEYPAGTEAKDFTFPERNRIISGLSKGVLVVEADVRSGALITAHLALEHNRDVFAVPGGIFSAKSIGTNRLIQQGAKLITSAQDILDEYGQAGPQARLKGMVSTRDPLEEKILGILDASGPTFVDTVIRQCQEPAQRVSATLAVLEIRGAIQNIGNGTYRVKK